MTTREISKRQRVVFGLIALATGIGTAAMIYLQPQQLRAPAWVAYAAASTFSLAGIALTAGALGAERLVPWIGTLIVGALLVPSLWVALGPGGGNCAVSIGGVRGPSPQWMCRAGFGIGSLLALALLVPLLRRAISSTSREREDSAAVRARNSR